MNPTISGIHHITAITADAQKNIDFYCGVLGLRLVKLTVNFDDPGSYHLYYGDDLGHPGSILTFFAWGGAYRGRIGPPQVTTTAFAVPSGAQQYWTERLHEHGVALQPAEQRLGEQVLSFVDPDGLRLEIVAAGQTFNHAALTGGPVPPEHSIRGFHSATLAEEGYESTARLLTEVMGFRAIGSDGNRFRYRAAGDSEFASTIDLLSVPNAPRGRMGAGVVHHIAFRTPSDEQQEVWRRTLGSLGYNVTPVMDRTYFHSIYYPEPGGVLFEIATEPPGFTVDQKPEELGTGLMLPPWLEPHRAQIEQVLPPVRVPERHVEMHG
jgi:glyoxalase family protein